MFNASKLKMCQKINNLIELASNNYKFFSQLLKFQLTVNTNYYYDIISWSLTSLQLLTKFR